MTDNNANNHTITTISMIVPTNNVTMINTHSHDTRGNNKCRPIGTASQDPLRVMAVP